MRKVSIFFFSILSSVFLLGNVFAQDLPYSATSILDSFVSKIIVKRSVLPATEQAQKFTSMISLLDQLMNKVDSTKKPLVEYLQNEFSERQAINGALPNSSTYTIPHVDLTKVRQARLDMHNDVRSELGLPDYKRNSLLENTAISWAWYLSSINSSTHKRNPGDGYYEYDTIKDRFADKGVSFDESKGTAFSESIAYQYYYCTKTDCTQDLINAIRKGFDFFMSEESYKGPHYNAIVHPYFTDIGMGVSFVGKRYYVVTHYGYLPR